MADKLEQVAIRMVEQPPLYSKEPMNNPDAAIRVMNEFLSQMDSVPLLKFPIHIVLA